MQEISIESTEKASVKLHLLLYEKRDITLKSSFYI